MRLRKRMLQSGAELPLVISDHADWPDLQRTILDTGAEEIWITHGREGALIHFCETQGLRGRALALIGRDEDDDA
jgi:putative mRNA 3-end processing factor